MRYIAIEAFCFHHGVEVMLVREFADFGLIRLERQEDKEVVPEEEVPRLERMLRLSQELEVNKEGIAVIMQMREELKQLRRERDLLTYRLRQLEEERTFRLVHQPQNQGFLIDYSGMD
ncbi:MAG: chaperone modulator CbpM [Adhaeribacter sp.]